MGRFATAKKERESKQGFSQNQVKRERQELEMQIALILDYLDSNSK